MNLVRWSSELIQSLSQEVTRPEHHGRILPGYPRTEVQMLESHAPRTSDESNVEP